MSFPKVLKGSQQYGFGQAYFNAMKEIQAEVILIILALQIMKWHCYSKQTSKRVSGKKRGE